MSFILDALKKSEGERQRQTGPTIFEVKVAPPKNSLPVWAILIGVLLAVNLSVVGWLLWGNASRPETPPPVAVSPGTSQQTPLGQPANAATSQYMPPQPAPAARRNTLPDVADAGAEDPVLEEDAADEEVAMNPEDYEPALEAPPPRRPARNESSGVVRGTSSGLPTYADAKASATNIPELRLDLHVYSPAPDKRFVFLNMQKLQEGQSMSEGVRVDSITPTGAELSYQGKRFVLMRD
jgi:general secretion pathway protein B